MAAMATSSMRLLKIQFDDDLRRTQVELPISGSASSKLRALRVAVGACFGMDISELPILKYQDDDEDMCTLVEETVEDLLQLSADGPLYLFASAADGHEPTGAEALQVVDIPDVQLDQDTVLEESEKVESLISPLLAIGFGKSESIVAIEKAKGNLEFAVAALLRGGKSHQRSLIGRLFALPQLAVASGYSPTAGDHLQESGPNDQGLEEVDFDSVAVYEESRCSDMNMSMDDVQQLRDEIEKVDSSASPEAFLEQPPRISGGFEKASSSNNDVELETLVELGDADQMSSEASFESSIEEFCEEAYLRKASPIDKGQVLVSRLLSAMRFRLSPDTTASPVDNEESYGHPRSRVDCVVNAVDAVQHAHDKVDTCEAVEEHDSREVEDTCSSEVQAGIENCNVEPISNVVSAHETSFESSDEVAFDCSAKASPVDKGQVLISHLLCAIRTRYFQEGMNIAMNEDAAMGALRNEAEELDSFETLEQFLGCSEACVEAIDVEYNTMSSDPDEASLEPSGEDAFEGAVKASPVDKGQMLISNAISAIRTRLHLV
jgi:hypothetical protein